MGKTANPTKPKHKSAKIIPFFQTGEYYFARGLKAYRKRDLYKAKKYLYRATQLEPQDPIFLCQLAVVLTELGEYQQSNKLLMMIVEEIELDMYECNYFIANNFAHLGLFREAKKYAQIYLEQDPEGEFSEDNADLLDLLNIEAEDAEEDMENQDDLIVDQENARNLLEEGHFQDAIQLLDRIIEKYPEFWSAYNNLALAKFYSGDVSDAMAILETVLEKNHGNLHALCNMLVFYYYLRDDKNVRQLVKRLEKVQPILVEHRYKLGATFSLVGRFDLGYRWLKQLYKQGFNGDSAFYYWLSYAAYFTGHESFARSIWKRVLEENPNKVGGEPWNQGENQSFEHAGLLLLEGKEKHERLFGLFLLSLQHDFDFQVVKPLSDVEADFIEYMCHKNNRQDIPTYIVKGYEITQLLYEKNSDLRENQQLFFVWLETFIKAIQAEEKLQNVSAWAAAVEYTTTKNQHKEVTQKQIADRYHISSSTVKKYVKIVNTLLQ